MMNFEYNMITLKRLPYRISEAVTFGHIDKRLFEPNQIKEMKENTLKDLATQKISLWSTEKSDYVKEAIGLWGEDSENVNDDMGLACLFIDEHSIPLPKHFMDNPELYEFIITTVENDYPEYLI